MIKCLAKRSYRRSTACSASETTPTFDFIQWRFFFLSASEFLPSALVQYLISDKESCAWTHGFWVMVQQYFWYILCDLLSKSFSWDQIRIAIKHKILLFKPLIVFRVKYEVMQLKYSKLFANFPVGSRYFCLLERHHVKWPQWGQAL